MHIGLRVKSIIDDIGTKELLYAFFSTVHSNLEKEGDWGSRFPVLLNDLNSGTVESESGQKALNELDAIEAELYNLTVDNLVWNFKNPSDQPPDYLDPDSENLSGYFITPTGRNLINKLRKNIERMIHKESKLVIERIPPPRGDNKTVISYGTKQQTH